MPSDTNYSFDFDICQGWRSVRQCGSNLIKINHWLIEIIFQVKIVIPFPGQVLEVLGKRDDIDEIKGLEP
ncbi:unnamed protein product [Penicillium pancosmium]